MRRRYKCPKHQERTPSAVVYGEQYFCFGCSARGPVTELGVTPDAEDARYVEDIKETYLYIDQLPRLSIRGLSLPSDGGGYFVPWPDRSYYKYRRFDAEGAGGKYRSPSGVKPTLLKARMAEGSILVIMEGEINALSTALALESVHSPISVVSPGGAGNFKGRLSEECVKAASLFDTVYIVCDSDSAGASAAIQLKISLVAAGKHRTFIELWQNDANEVLVSHGLKGLVQKTHNLVGMPTRMQKSAL